MDNNTLVSPTLALELSTTMENSIFVSPRLALELSIATDSNTFVSPTLALDWKLSRSGRTTSIVSDEPRAETLAAMRTRFSPTVTPSSRESWWACLGGRTKTYRRSCKKWIAEVGGGEGEGGAVGGAVEGGEGGAGGVAGVDADGNGKKITKNMELF